VINSLVPNEERLLEEMSPELFAAHKAFELVKQGESFRDAYVEVGANLDAISVDKENILTMLKQSTHQGGVGNLQLDKLSAEAKSLRG